MLNAAINCYPFHTDLIPALAKDIAENHQQQWPFLQDVIVLLPHYQRAADLQQAILTAFCKAPSTAMIGPQIYSFKDYIDQSSTLNQPTIPNDARELILIDALQQHGDLFGQNNLLTTAYALLELFDELTREQVSLPENLDHFIAQLQHAYQCQTEQNTALSKEAQIVHTLWFAWHQQLKELKHIDKESQYQLKLAKNLKQESNKFYYIAGFYHFLPAEIKWIKYRLKQNHARLYFQTATTQNENFKNFLNGFSSSINQYTSENNLNQFFQAVFDKKTDHLKTRAIQAGNQLKPINDTLSIFSAKSFEEEAQAITLQIRLWLKQKKYRLALILEDRHLARRIRALLQRNGIGMTDASGWALSTTTAASVIESWLQCIEENFHYTPLLDILKSPFAFEQTDTHSQLVYHFEQDLILRENISRDLSRYQTSCLSRQKRLGNEHNETSTKLIALLEHLANAAETLQSLKQKPDILLTDVIQALITSLSKLNAYQLLASDAAGKATLDLLKKLNHAASNNDISMSWVSFRHWLGLKLEENNVSLDTQSDHAIELLHLSQTALRKYDGLIIGNMSKDQFPGASKQTPFFNQNVRQDLGLKSLEEQRYLKYYYFRQLLESAPDILLSYHSGPQESLPCPWLELIARFHELAFSQDLENQTLHQIIHQQASDQKTEIYKGDSDRAPTITEDMLPDSLSASAHQTLIQCPYAFFASQILKLRATDEISEKLAKSDYGERVHLCLHAFHVGGVKNIAGPFPTPVTAANKTKATEFLVGIARQVFANDLEDNFQHRGWLKRWLKIVPAYIDWQIQHGTHWHFKTGEIKTSMQIAPGISLHGRIDRVDQSALDISIMDYKTGSVPHTQEVENGEAVQLTHYAMANPDKVSRVAYLQFESGSKDVAEKCIFENETLDLLTMKTQTRLIDIYQAMKQGAALQPWGNDKVCQHCQFAGLCRHKLQ